MNNLVIVKGGRDTLEYTHLCKNLDRWTLLDPLGRPCNTLDSEIAQAELLQPSCSPAFYLKDHPLDDPYSSIFIIQRYMARWTRNIPSQTAMGDKNPSGWGGISWLGVIICRGFKECDELTGLASELELHKHFIWPLLIYAQNRILLLVAGFRLFIWRGDSLRPDNHVFPFTLAPRSVPQRVILILDLANGCKRGWMAGTVGVGWRVRGT